MAFHGFPIKIPDIFNFYHIIKTKNEKASVGAVLKPAGEKVLPEQLEVKIGNDNSEVNVMNHETIENRLAYIENQLERLLAINEIQNLVGKYELLHTPKSFEQTLSLFALKQPDVSVEIADWGVYTGAEQIKTFYQNILKAPLVGAMFEHQLTTPVIVVAGDCKTAKGVWFSPGHETVRENDRLQAYWCYGKYEADFIKEDGQWKIWHWHLYDTFRTPYEKSWVDAGPGSKPPILTQYPADKPTTFNNAYRIDRIQEPRPSCPEPYETWIDPNNKNI